MAVSSLTWLPGSGIGKIVPLALLGPGPVGPIGPFGPGTRSAHWPHWARVPLAHLGPGPAGPLGPGPVGPIGPFGPGSYWPIWARDLLGPFGPGTHWAHWAQLDPLAPSIFFNFSAGVGFLILPPDFHGKSNRTQPYIYIYTLKYSQVSGSCYTYGVL